MSRLQYTEAQPWVRLALPLPLRLAVAALQEESYILLLPLEVQERLAALPRSDYPMPYSMAYLRRNLPRPDGRTLEEASTGAKVARLQAAAESFFALMECALIEGAPMEPVESLLLLYGNDDLLGKPLEVQALAAVKTWLEEEAFFRPNTTGPFATLLSFELLQEALEEFSQWLLEEWAPAHPEAFQRLEAWQEQELAREDDGSSKR